MAEILQVGGSKNSLGGWSEKNCDSADGWSDNSGVVTLPTNFFNGIALSVFCFSSVFDSLLPQ